MELLIGRGRGGDVSARVRGLDLLYERLEVGGTPLRSQFLQPLHAGQLDYLARREQIVDLLIGQLSDHRPAVHLVANEVFAFQDPDGLADRVTGDAELFGERQFAQRRPRKQPAFEDCRPEGAGDLLCGAVALDRGPEAIECPCAPTLLLNTGIVRHLSHRTTRLRGLYDTERQHLASAQGSLPDNRDR